VDAINCRAMVGHNGLLVYGFVNACGTVRSYTPPVAVGLLSGKREFNAAGAEAVAAESPG